MHTRPEPGGLLRNFCLGAAPPLLGQHTEDVLRELGYSGGQLADFKKRGVI